ncbi:hypothetical protein [Streptomyces vietnamensis]|uniref:hypothetical protein n=1 Tax=Streptomyces vietnamensis TaxID=362257 RepID=UPI0007C72451|nr:hypothetical protein [Streptomyces vietnamensis]
MAVAHLLVQNDDVVVRLSWREALLVRRKGVRVPLGDVREAWVEPDWWRALRGTVARGRWRPGRFCTGTRRHADGVDFVAVRAPGPVAVVELFPGRRFARLAVSTVDSDGAVQAVRLAARRHRGDRRPGGAGTEVAASRQPDTDAAT